MKHSLGTSKYGKLKRIHTAQYAALLTSFEKIATWGFGNIVMNREYKSIDRLSFESIVFTSRNFI
jgi:hypothetical protein